MPKLPDNAPSPRICRIVKWPDFEGYGFNLHADKNRPGQYIGKVDEGSPAELAGLRQGDRIIEVNGVNVANENHKQVVNRIKAMPNETTLLVVDRDADQWYRSHGIVVKGDQANVTHGTSERSDSQANGSPEEADNRSVSSAASSTPSESSTQPQPIIPSSVQESNASRDPDEEIDGYQESAKLGGDLLSDNCSSDPLTTEAEDLKLPESDATSSEGEMAVQHNREERKLDQQPEFVDEEALLNCDPQDVSIQRSEGDLFAGCDDDNVLFRKEQDTENDLAEKSVESRSSQSQKSDSFTENDVGSQETAVREDSEETPMSMTPSPPPSMDEVKSQSLDTKKESPVSTVNRATVASANTTSGLNLNMTAAEMRAHLASRKKFDPRKDSVDLRKKYEIIQNM